MVLRVKGGYCFSIYGCFGGGGGVVITRDELPGGPRVLLRIFLINTPKRLYKLLKITTTLFRPNINVLRKSYFIHHTSYWFIYLYFYSTYDSKTLLKHSTSPPPTTELTVNINGMHWKVRMAVIWRLFDPRPLTVNRSWPPEHVKSPTHILKDVRKAKSNGTPRYFCRHFWSGGRNRFCAQHLLNFLSETLKYVKLVQVILGKMYQDIRLMRPRCSQPLGTFGYERGMPDIFAPRV